MDLLNKIIDSKKLDYIKKNWDFDTNAIGNFRRFFKMDVINNNGMTLEGFAGIIGAELTGNVERNTVVKRVLTQSVYAAPGDVVISAGWYPKINTVKEALSKGALAVFCDKETKAQFPQDKVIAIEDPLGAVLKFENWRAEGCNAKRITITGSVGKTTMKDMIASVLSEKYKVVATEGNYNNNICVPRTLFRI